MNDETKIQYLEEKILSMEKENRALRAMLKNQYIFGQKIVEIVAKMDLLLDEKKNEIETLELNCSMLNESINTLGQSLALARAGLDEKNDLLDDIIIIEDDDEVDKEVEQEAEKAVETEQETDAEVETDIEKEAEVENGIEIEVEMSDEKEIEFVKEEVEQVVEKNENQLTKPTNPENIQFERNEDGKFECPYAACTHTSRDRSQLKYHIRSSHTGERPFSCDYCESKFVRASDCKRHMTKHQKENKNLNCPFKNLCNYTSISSEHLKRHIRKHTGEKPFSCQYCEKHFSERSNRDRHQLTHPESNGEACKSCHRWFKPTEIENHSQRCGIRKALKRKRLKVEEESKAHSQFVSFIV